MLLFDGFGMLKTAANKIVVHIHFSSFASGLAFVGTLEFQEVSDKVPIRYYDVVIHFYPFLKMFSTTKNPATLSE